jgi:flagellar hook-associated protein 1 FlgK
MTITSGELYGLLNARDNILPTIETDLNNLVNALIAEFNKIHSQGNGLSAFTSLTSDNFVLAGTEGNDLDDPATGLAFTPVDGSFEINVIDATGAVSTTTITVDLDGVGADDSLNDLAANLNAVADISASVSNGRLVITADPTYSFTFSNDSSNVLQVLGLNTFFSGSNATNIDINSVVENNLTLIAASLSTDPLATGNNENALNLAGLQQGLVMESGIATLGDSLNATVSNIGNVANRLDLEAQTQDLFVREMDARRQQVSGVDLNEEAANLIRFQRGFEAAARLITVTDAMLEAVIRM